MINLHPKLASEARDSLGAVGYFGATVFPFKGLWVTAFAEGKQTDIKIKDSTTTAYGGQLNWFPYPHVEIVWVGRIQVPSGISESAKMAFLFVHYYL
jgi:hypothetical protein